MRLIPVAILAAAAAAAGMAAAQPARSPMARPSWQNEFFRPDRHAAYDQDTRAALPTGRLSRLSAGQRGYVAPMLEPAQEAVRRELLNPRSARFTGLRMGVYNDIAVLCGVVSAEGADGVRATERFIARPAAATLESEVGAAALAAAEAAIGCRR